MSRIFDKVKKVSNLQESKSPADNLMLLKRALKLTEESGEIAAEVLKMVEYKLTNETHQQIKDNLKEEAVDALITALDIINHLKMSEEEVEYIMEGKLSKWENNHLSRTNVKPIVNPIVTTKISTASVPKDSSQKELKMPDEWMKSKQKKKNG